MNQFPGMVQRQAVEPKPSEHPKASQILKDSYNNLQSWKDSEAVVIFSEYLKTCEGMQLVSDDGCLVLHFNPGLQPDKKQRWKNAVQALSLLEAAYNDLQQLIKNKKLKLKKVSF